MLTAAIIWAAMVATAQGAPPTTQPTWFHFSKAVTAGIAFSAGALTSRIWVPTKNLVIVCSAEKGAGTLEGTGLDKNSMAYTGCKPFKPKENANTPKQFEQEKEYAECMIKTAGAANGEIKIESLNSKLAWVKSTSEPSVVVDVYKTAAAPFVLIKIEGAACMVKGEYKIEGSVNGRVQSYSTSVLNNEAIMGNQLFEVVNEEAGGKALIRQGYREWLVENGGAGKEGKSELTITEGTTIKLVALESAEQVELNEVSGLRGLYAAHE